MSGNISVCIICNKIDTVLYKTVASYIHCVDEICLGINQVTDEKAMENLASRFNTRLRIFDLIWSGYGSTKNELQSLATYDWILSVDADEVADELLQRALLRFSPNGHKQIYEVRIQHFYAEKKIQYGAWGRGKQYFARLYNRTNVKWDEATVHESLVYLQQPERVRMEGAIQHYTVSDYANLIEKSRHYAKLSADKKIKSGKKSFPGKPIFAAIFTFVKEYFFYLGCLDGKEGLHIAYANSLYSYTKYYLLRQKLKK